MKQKIFFTIFLALLFFVNVSSAARTAPVGTPLQPIPQDTGPGYTRSVNTPDSSYSQSQALDQKQIAPQVQTPAPAGNAVVPSPAGLPATNSVASSTEPVLLYWILLIAGSLGLIGALAWLYFRFRQ